MEILKVQNYFGHFWAQEALHVQNEHWMKTLAGVYRRVYGTNHIGSINTMEEDDPLCLVGLAEVLAFPFLSLPPRRALSACLD